MKFLKVGAIVLICLILSITLVSLFLPSAVRIERKVEIDRPARLVFPIINNLHNWEKWFPWYQAGNNMLITYGETTEGAGAYCSLISSGTHMGNGSLTITQSENEKQINMDLIFRLTRTGKATFTFDENTGEKTTVTWLINDDLGLNPVNRWFGIWLTGILKTGMEAGLLSIKEVAESIPKSLLFAGFEARQQILDTMIIAGIRQHMLRSELKANTLGKLFVAINKQLIKENIKIKGRPMLFYHQFNTDTIEIEAAVQVESAGFGNANVQFSQLFPASCLVVDYYGSYNRTRAIYTAAFEHFEKNNLTHTAPFERYVINPSEEPDSTQWHTQIVFPLN